MAIFAHKLLTREEVLDNELRKAIMEHLSENPGSYLGKISRELKVPTSTLKYHLNILRSFDLVSTVKKGRCRHYFPKRKRFTDVEKKMYAAIEHGPTRRIVQIIADNPGISQGGLVQATGLSQSTVAWHMAKLEEMNLIRSERNDVKEYFLRSDFREVLRLRFAVPAGEAGAAPMAPAPAVPSPFASTASAPVMGSPAVASPFASAAPREPPSFEPGRPPPGPGLPPREREERETTE